MLQEKTKAPHFTLPDKDNHAVSLSDFLGKKVVLYFYPKDGTPGWTKQAQRFAALNEEFKKLNTVVIGINVDNTTSHQKFSEKNQLPFILLSDAKREVVKRYDVWSGNGLLSMLSMGTERSTYVIDEDGMIVKAMPNVQPDSNASEILAYLKGTKN